jgi:hypothetical protein
LAQELPLKRITTLKAADIRTTFQWFISPPFRSKLIN